MLKAEDILPTSKAERARLRLRKRFRKYKKRHPRTKLSPDEMLQYLRDHGIRSCVVLERTREPDDPNTNDFKRVFGKWTEAVRQAFGSEIAVDVNSEYLIKAVQELNLWSQKRFREVRKQYPDVVPSWFVVKKKFGSYRNLIESARRRNLRMLLVEYKKLMRRFGRPPTLAEVRDSNLRMDEAIAFYGGKKQMDDFVMSMKG
jgi:hypothetical protein